MNPYEPPQTESPKQKKWPWCPSDDLIKGMFFGIGLMTLIMQIVLIAVNMFDWLLWR